MKPRSLRVVRLMGKNKSCKNLAELWDKCKAANTPEEAHMYLNKMFDIYDEALATVYTFEGLLNEEDRGGW